MKRFFRSLWPVFWTLFFIVPSLYFVVWAIESGYQVPLEQDSFRFEHPYAWLLIGGALLALFARGWLNAQRAPRLQVSRVRDLAMVKRASWRSYLRHAGADGGEGSGGGSGGRRRQR